MSKHIMAYPNPQKQEEFDIVLERLLKDEKYLHFAFALTELRQGLYDTTYELVTYRQTEEDRQRIAAYDEPEGKYALKILK